MKNFKKVFLVAALFVAGALCFAENWYVCAGSYKVYDNAQNLVESLQKKGLSSFIYEAVKADGTKLYRVLLDEGFSNSDDARDSCDFMEKDAAIKALRITGLWICKAEKPAVTVVSAPASAPVETPAVVENPVVETPASAESSDSGEYIRIELTWVEKGLDLDAVMTTSKMFVDYDTPSMGGVKLVCDQDSAAESETVYVDYLEDGETYSFYVLDPDYVELDDSVMLSNSGAQVQVFANGSCLATFNVEPETIGTTWHVFDISADGSITAIEDLSNEQLYE